MTLDLETLRETQENQPGAHADWTTYPPLVRRLPEITAERIHAFGHATRSEHFVDSPPTYPTTFRSTEFEWLDILKIDLHHLLHTEQEYEYLQPLREGDVPVVTTRVTEHRERRGLLFVVLETEVHVQEKLVVTTRSSFVVRSGDSA